MKDALGLVEIEGLATAILVADTMVKAARVDIVQIERTSGLGWITIKISGDVAAVNAAVSAGKRVGEMYNHFVSVKVIPRPSNSVDKVFCQNTKYEKYVPHGRKLAIKEKVNKSKKIGKNKSKSNKDIKKEAKHRKEEIPKKEAIDEKQLKEKNSETNKTDINKEKSVKEENLNKSSSKSKKKTAKSVKSKKPSAESKNIKAAEKITENKVIPNNNTLEKKTESIEKESIEPGKGSAM